MRSASRRPPCSTPRAGASTAWGPVALRQPVALQRPSLPSRRAPAVRGLPAAGWVCGLWLGCRPGPRSPFPAGCCSSDFLFLLGLRWNRFSRDGVPHLRALLTCVREWIMYVPGQGMGMVKGWGLLCLSPGKAECTSCSQQLVAVGRSPSSGSAARALLGSR